MLFCQPFQETYSHPGSTSGILQCGTLYCIKTLPGSLNEINPAQQRQLIDRQASSCRVRRFNATIQAGHAQNGAFSLNGLRLCHHFSGGFPSQLLSRIGVGGGDGCRVLRGYKAQGSGQARVRRRRRCPLPRGALEAQPHQQRYREAQLGEWETHSHRRCLSGRQECDYAGGGKAQVRGRQRKGTEGAPGRIVAGRVVVPKGMGRLFKTRRIIDSTHLSLPVWQKAAYRGHRHAQSSRLRTLDHSRLRLAEFFVYLMDAHSLVYEEIGR